MGVASVAGAAARFALFLLPQRFYDNFALLLRCQQVLPFLTPFPFAARLFSYPLVVIAHCAL